MSATDEQLPPIRAHLLGQVRLAVGAREIPDSAWRRRAERSLLLLLLMTPGHQLPRDRLLDLLWPEAPLPTALNSLYKALHAMRRVLEPDLAHGRSSAYVETGAELIALRPLPGTWVDLDAFTEALTRARTATGDARRTALREAVELYAGDLLANEPYADWPVARRENLRLARERAVLELADLDVAAGEPLSTISALEALLTADRTNEETHRRLIRAFAAAGLPDRAQRQLQRCQQILADELGTTPSAQTLAALSVSPAASRFDHPSTRHAARYDLLPVRTKPLIGRRHEIEAVEGRLWRQDVRLVTLTGPPGIGKTQLAIEVARRLRDEFADGVAFIPLATLRDPALIPQRIAEQLDLRLDIDVQPAALLGALLRERELLLVLDNFEQLLAGATIIADLLATCPQLKFLVTSRERLSLRGEHEYPVPPLTLPNPSRLPDAATLSSYEAAALFLDRIHAVVPDFQPTPEQAHAIAKLCLRLDGLPLAIELAAGQCRRMDPVALLHHLADERHHLSDLAHDPAAQQHTLRETLDWSYQLLTDDEQALFRRLAVFADGCTEEAAAWVIWHPTPPLSLDGNGAAAAPRLSDVQIPFEIFDGLSSLIDKSLLRRVEQPGGEIRYRMLAVIQEYAATLLAASDEESELRDRHASYFLQLAETANQHSLSAVESTWHNRLEPERANLQAALAWLMQQHRTGEALRLAIALHWFWHVRCRFSEGCTWLDQTLAADQIATSDPPEIALARRARGLFALGLMIWFNGDYDRALACHEESRALAERLGDRFGVGRALLGLGDTYRHLGDLTAAERHLEAAIAIFREQGATAWIAMTLTELGPVVRRQGAANRALPLAHEALTLCRTIGYQWGIAQALFNLGQIWHDLGVVDRAAPLFVQSLKSYWAERDRWGTADNLAALAAIAGNWDQPVPAVQLFGAAAAIYASFGMLPAGQPDPASSPLLAQLREELGADAFTRAWETGQLMTPEEAIAEAAKIPDSAPAVEESA